MTLRHLPTLLLIAVFSLNSQALPPAPGGNPHKTKLDLSKLTDAKGHFFLDKIRAMRKIRSDSDPWATYGMGDHNVPGTNTERAYQLIHSYPERDPRRAGTPIIVAVIDSDFDLNHEDLQGKWAVNEAEQNGTPGVDDDGDGYVDNKLGWNFLGSVTKTTLEITREYVRIKDDPTQVEKRDKMKAVIDSERKDAQDNIDAIMKLVNDYVNGLAALRADGYTGGETAAEIEAYQIRGTPEVAQAKQDVLYVLNIMAANGLETLDELREATNDYRVRLDYNYNPEMVGRTPIEGDLPQDANQTVYGDNDVSIHGDIHGTHVAGIITAIRGNGLGADGQADNVKILPIRAVPDGDERDKDVANAIRYAVDHGARIINMSFGKYYNSPQYPSVQAAIRHAEENQVLLVAAAGNEGRNLDQYIHYPDPRAHEDGSSVNNWIMVGASTRYIEEHLDDYGNPERLTAHFSNYGSSLVDLFAPGYEILSSIPGEMKYKELNGTSMASPETTGVAALVLSRYPNLSAAELKDILVRSVNTQFSQTDVTLPQDSENPHLTASVPFGSLSTSRGIVDAYAALKLAADEYSDAR